MKLPKHFEAFVAIRDINADCESPSLFLSLLLCELIENGFGLDLVTEDLRQIDPEGVLLRLGTWYDRIVDFIANEYYVNGYENDLSFDEYLAISSHPEWNDGTLFSVLKIMENKSPELLLLR